MLAGSRHLLLKNVGNLSDHQAARLDDLLAANGPLNAVHALKEQLQQLWHAPAKVWINGANPPKPPVWRP